MRSNLISFVSNHYLDHSTFFCPRKLLFFKSVHVCVVQPYPEQPSNIWKYPLNLSVMLFPSHFDTLIIQSSHAAHTLHIKNQCKIRTKLHFSREKYCITVMLNSTKDLMGRTKRCLLRRCSKFLNVQLWILSPR